MVTIVDTPFYTIGMNYACEITYPVGESINGGIMMSASQIAGIGGTFLCDYFIGAYPEKKWITNLIMSIFFGIACVFVFLFDEKLDRHEIDAQGRKQIAEGKEDNKEKDDSDEKKNNEENLDKPDRIEIQNNNNDENGENNGINTAKDLLKA